MSDELKPCPFCGGPVTLELTHSSHHEIYGVRDWYGVKCRNTINLGGTCAIEQIPSASKEAATERWNRRTAPMGTNGEAIPLPPLPQADKWWREEFGLGDSTVHEGHSDEQMQQYARDAIAPYAERIAMHERVHDQMVEQVRDLSESLGLEREHLRQAVENIAKMKDAERARGAVQSIGDDSTFEDLAGDVYRAGSYNESIEKPMNALIAYIDGRTAGTAPGIRNVFEHKRIGEFTVQVTFRSARGCGEFIKQIAAAPTPLNGKEEAK